MKNEQSETARKKQDSFLRGTKIRKNWQKRQKSTIFAKITAHKERLFVKMFLYLQCYSPFKGGNRHNIGSVIGFFQDW